MSNPLPSLLALTSIADGSQRDAAPLRNNYSAIQAATNELIAALSGGLVGQALQAVDISDVQYAYPPGHEYDYKEFVASVAVTGTSGAQTTVITGNPVTLDGATVVYVEFFAEAVLAGANDQVIFELYDGATDLGQIGIVSAATVAVEAPAALKRRLTPSNGSHTYTVKAYRTTTNGSIIAGAGGAATPIPGFLRITKA